MAVGLMKKIALLCQAFVCVLAAVPAAAEDIHLITEDSPPFNYIDPKTGQITGVAHELVLVLMEGSGLSYHSELLPWQRGYRISMKKANTCIYGVNRTPEREELFEWVGPLFESGWALYSYDPELQIDSLSDITDQIVAVKAGDAITNAFIAARPDVKVLTAPSVRNGIRLLHHGRADLWLAGVAHVRQSAEIMKVPVPRQVFLWRKSVVYMACSKSTDQRKLARLRAALPVLDQSRDAILRKYW